MVIIMKNKFDKIKKALIWISDVIIFIFIAIWALSCVFVGILAVYDLKVNGSSEGISQFVTLVGIPFSAGITLYLARCTITHFFSNKNGKTPDPDFIEESEFVDNTSNVDLSEIYNIARTSNIKGDDFI